MHTLSQAQYLVEAKPIFQEIFAKDDAFGESFFPNFDEPFLSRIEIRKILYYLSNYLEHPLVEALAEAAKSVGDEGCYLSQFCRSNRKDAYNDCYIPLSELVEAYTVSLKGKKLIEVQLNIHLSLEYALYSAQGKWGLLVGFDHFGILGGSQNFMDVIEMLVPNIEQQVYEFLRVTKSGKDRGYWRNLEWLSKLLKHVHGQETAERMLREVDLL